MNKIASVIKMHRTDKWTWLLIPWMIMLSSFTVNFTISFFVDEPMITGGLSSIFIYVFITGIIILAQTFPFALGMSVSRTDYFWGTSVMILLSSIVSAALLLLLRLIETWTNAWGSDLHFFKLPYLSDGPLLIQFFVQLILLLFMYYFGFLIASTYRRTGRIGLFLIAGILLVLFTVLSFMANYLNWYPAIFDWMVNQSALDYALWMLPLVLLFSASSYLLLRRATI
ncbi:hypothetical protein BK133_07495 [Paenibacillus sp. FSL H8-0548]|uniref:hypothetical protein n=1 Tax=Paenibacillus sp. FSL H8-0548 TaxID=1920422 RepID=UPI00096CF16D|nr:hypothetical protein [Paenibacillus sp. FSL H8-0548]OMF37044.1 hypothetical protein BK133_07495 [Paenibacillus sp. FSL H8-0548]